MKVWKEHVPKDKQLLTPLNGHFYWHVYTLFL